MPPKSHYKSRKPVRGGGHRFTNPRNLESGDSEGWEYRNKREIKKDSGESSEENESGNELNGSNASESSEEELDESKFEISNPNRNNKKDSLKVSDISSTRELSRREREALEKEAARQRYWKLHLEGKTDQAKADLARLAVIRKQREEAASQRKADAEAKTEAHKVKLEKEGRR
ncbi:718_t:CDS:2, partial [Diversispora eburnea]